MIRFGARMILMTLLTAALIGLVAGSMGFGPGFGVRDEKGLADMAEREQGISDSGFRIDRLSDERIEQLATKLTDEERKVILNDGTEPAFCGNLVDNKKQGVYLCRLCELPLFASDSKFTSGTGWPSFFQPVDEAHIDQHKDLSFGMVRIEIECARCGGHLGHVFPDGPKPTGLRFCVNSASLSFVEDGEELPDGAKPDLKSAYFAGGCFWGVEDALQQIPGVLSAVSGYQGGTVENPGYKEVCTGRTGHAESVRVIFDPSEVSYRELLEWFFKIHNPTQGNRQGPDVGTQYRSAVFAADDEQKREAEEYVERLAASGKYGDRRITTQISDMMPFYEAEEVHQDYHLKHGGSCALPTD